MCAAMDVTPLEAPLVTALDKRNKDLAKALASAKSSGGKHLREKKALITQNKRMKLILTTLGIIHIHPSHPFIHSFILGRWYG